MLYLRVLNKYLIVYVWQGSEYIAVSKYVRVLSILGF